MPSPYVRSECCAAAVVGSVDVTVHPRLRADGSYGPLTDTMRDVRRHATMLPADDPHCANCGSPYDAGPSS